MIRKYDELDYDIMNFKPDTFNFFWLMIFIVLNTIAAINSTSLMNYSIRIFTFSLFNIILTLFLFLAAEKIKNYHIGWSYAVIITGVFQLCRLTFLPENTDTVLNILMYVFSGGIAILSGGFSLFKSINRQKRIQSKKEA